MSALLPAAWRRLQLSRAKHPSIAGHARLSRRIAGQIPFVGYDDRKFFDCDGAPADIAMQRRAAFERLAELLRDRAPRSIALTAELANGLSDVLFTDTYRMPFQFRERVRRHLKLGVIVEESHGMQLKDLDGNWSYDLAGSYGVNLFGYDFYKECIDAGVARVATLGPVLGAVSPDRRENVRRLKRDLGARRGVVPHVGHRGRDAGRAARAVPHAPADTSCCSAARTTAGGTACSPGSATAAASTTSTRSRK